MSVVACPTCAGAGVRSGRHGLRPCTRCGGSARVVVQDEEPAASPMARALGLAALVMVSGIVSAAVIFGIVSLWGAIRG